MPHCNLSSALWGLPSYSALIFLGAALPSISFSVYNLVWRRESFPMTGQGGSLQVTSQVNFVDILHAVLFVYWASRNPTWSAALFRWSILPFIFGLSLHVIADHSKYPFRKKPKNKGQVYTGGVWSVVRHPNFLGFLIWRVAFASAAGGWAFGGFMLSLFGYLFYNTAVPIIEDYMGRSYGKKWELATEKVRWKMIPGIW